MAELPFDFTQKLLSKSELVGDNLNVELNTSDYVIVSYMTYDPGFNGRIRTLDLALDILTKADDTCSDGSDYIVYAKEVSESSWNTLFSGEISAATIADAETDTSWDYKSNISQKNYNLSSGEVAALANVPLEFKITAKTSEVTDTVVARNPSLTVKVTGHTI